MSAQPDSYRSIAAAVPQTRKPCGPAETPNSVFRPERAAHDWRVLALLILAGVLSMAIDVPLSRALVAGQALHSLHHFLESFEPFGKPPTVIAVALAVLLCAGTRRGAGFRIAAAALLSGLAVDILKLFVARIRPRHFDFQGTVFDTFSGALPGTGAGSKLQSWPSGHTATAVGFCLALSVVFPRGRLLFWVLAALVALQRIESGAHYLSDTLFAAGVAYAVVMIVFGCGPVGRWFDRVELRWGTSVSIEA